VTREQIERVAGRSRSERRSSGGGGAHAVEGKGGATRRCSLSSSGDWECGARLLKILSRGGNAPLDLFTGKLASAAFTNEADHAHAPLVMKVLGE
jgi:hypothetical protein